MRATDFGLAISMVRLVVRGALMAERARTTGVELSKTQRMLVAHTHEEARLRKAMHQIIPAVSEATEIQETESHAGQMLHQVLEFLEENCFRPITLKECAVKFGLNPCYLSTLFSRTAGVPFKAYLTEVRLSKAKEKLHDPFQRVSDVALQIGYTDPNRFRLAFKAATGVSPTEWREMLRVR